MRVDDVQAVGLADIARLVMECHYTQETIGCKVRVDDMAPPPGPGRHYSPRFRMPFNSRNDRLYACR
jgi:hypothetical protein